MRRSLAGIYVIFVVSIFFSGAIAVSAEDKPPRLNLEDYRACGVVSLYTCARMQKLGIDIEKLDKDLPSGPLHSLEQLRQAAEKQGILALPVHLDFDDLRHLNSFALIHLASRTPGENDHFVSFVGVDRQGAFCIIDAPEPPKFVSQEVLGSRWTGNCLLICKDEDQRRQIVDYLSSRYPPLYRNEFVVLNSVGLAVCAVIWKLRSKIK